MCVVIGIKSSALLGHFGPLRLLYFLPAVFFFYFCDIYLVYFSKPILYSTTNSACVCVCLLLVTLPNGSSSPHISIGFIIIISIIVIIFFFVQQQRSKFIIVLILFFQSCIYVSQARSRPLPATFLTTIRINGIHNGVALLFSQLRSNSIRRVMFFFVCLMNRRK